MTDAGDRRALVLGSNGQDGSFLVEHLLRRGYQVIGVSRQEQSVYRGNSSNFRYKSFDLRRPGLVEACLGEVRPELIFHVAAVHGEAGSLYEPIWQDMLAVNVGVTHLCLEYLRTQSAAGGLVYAGSCKVFGPVYPEIVSEQSEVRSTCLYTVTKNASRDLIDCYRRDHGVRASVLHLFNHESERRAPRYFIPTLVATLRGALTSRAHRTEVNSLRFHCDWGSAEEYMDIAIDIGEKALGEDVIVASGRTWLAAELANSLFQRFGLDYRDHIVERDGAVHERPFYVQTDKLARLVGRTPKIQATEICTKILDLGPES